MNAPSSRNSLESLTRTVASHGQPGSLLPYLHRIILAYQRRIHAFGLQTGLAVTLMCIYQEPEKLEPAKLAELCDIPRQTMTSIIDALERRAYAERETHPTDRRRKLVRLLPGGRDLAERIIKDLLTFEAKALDVITAGQRPLARELVRRFTEELDRLNAFELPDATLSAPSAPARAPAAVAE